MLPWTFFATAFAERQRSSWLTVGGWLPIKHQWLFACSVLQYHARRECKTTLCSAIVPSSNRF
jgi:hypothetical protein